jgi:outer membrane protein assembly factor BamB
LNQQNIMSSVVIDNAGLLYCVNQKGEIYQLYQNGTTKTTKSISPAMKVKYQSPVLTQNNLLVVPTSEPGYLVAFDILTAGLDQVWTYDSTCTNTESGPKGMDLSSTPSVDDEGNIYFGDMCGNFHAVYPDGTRKWMTSVSTSYDGFAFGGCAISPNQTVRTRT